MLESQKKVKFKRIKLLSNQRKKKYFLVTTPIKNTWTKFRQIVFAGYWCVSDENNLPPNSQIIKSRWTNHKNLKKDYAYTVFLYEKLLPHVSSVLNKYHQTSYSTKYWRILIGPWLAIFIQIMYARWNTISAALKKKPMETIVIQYNPLNYIPSDMNEFSRFASTDKWNHYIFSLCISHFREMGVEIGIKYKKPNADKILLKTETLYQKVLIRLKKILSNVCAWCAQNNHILLINSYLGHKNEFLINLKNKQFPLFYYPLLSEKKSPDLHIRQTLFLKIESENNFEKFLLKNIFLQIPTQFLESYLNMTKKNYSRLLPKKPKVIISGDFMYDSLLSEYIARQTENGCKFIITQHGGYGVPKFMFQEYYELSTADYFMSWGWKSKKKRNILPVGLIKPITCYKKQNNSDKILLVRGLWSPYSYRLDSASGVNLRHEIDAAIRFASSLPECLQKNLIVRLYPKDYGLKEEYRWRKKNLPLSFNNGKSSIAPLVSNSKIVVYSYNVGTGYIEFLAANIPTIMYWNMATSPIRDSAKKIFDELKKVKIFHETPESAALHIKSVWSNLSDWWNCNETMLARKNFLMKYGNASTCVADNVNREILHIIKK